RTTDPNAPLPRSAEGVLIGAVSNDTNAPIVELGLSREFVADRDGRLYLTANRSSNPAPVRPRTSTDTYGGGRPNNERIQREKTLAVPANLRNGVDTGVDL